MFLESLEERRLLATVTVDSTSDVSDGDTSSITALSSTPGADGTISLREAITAANNTAGSDEIAFNIPGAGPHAIQPTTPLPSIIDTVTIDGYTQTGATANTGTIDQSINAVPQIELDGSLASSPFSAINLANGSSGSALRGLVINRFNGIAIRIDNSDNNTIAGNFLGTDTLGAAALGNQKGVLIVNGNDNIIGGITANARNVISGNNGSGIEIVVMPGSTATGNRLQGNFIGTTKSGTMPLANAGHGVLILASTANLIGGDTVATRNVISGNLGSGVELRDNAASNQVFGNFIGTDLSGNVAIANSEYGVGIYNAQDNLIGDSTTTVGTGRGNLISGNAESGVDIDSGNIAVGDPSTGNLVRGNIIGLNAAGTAQLGNREQGVAIINASNNTVGGPSADDGNLISSNFLEGVLIASQNVGIAADTGSGFNLVQNNSIGTDITAASDQGNGLAGVVIFDAISNTIADNVIAFNSQQVEGTGIEVLSGTGNVFTQNSIFFNGGLGIDLQNDNVTPNDSGDLDVGANNLQNYPMLTSATSGTSTVIRGDLNSLPNETFRIEYFANAFADPSGFGEGRLFLGFENIATDSSGTATIAFTSPTLVQPPLFVTSTATLIQVNGTETLIETSEFSNAVQINRVVVPQADLSLTKTVDTATATVGQTVTFTVTLTNSGPDAATNIAVLDLIPAGLSNPIVTPTAGTFADGFWTIATLANGTSATLTIAGQVAAGTTQIDNTAELIFADQADPDSTPDNQDPNEDDRDTASVVVAATQFDFGDAPDGIVVDGVSRQYPVLLVNDGARHTIVTDGPFLGSRPGDPETDGQPNSTATGDDADTDGDDEDVVGNATLTVTAGQPLSSLTLAHDGGNDGALLNLWIDLDQDGTWTVDEQILIDQSVAAGPGTTSLASITLPIDATPGTTFARARISTQTALPVGGVATDGEVEDFTIDVLQRTAPDPVTATKDDQLVTDSDGDGRGDSGDVIGYTVRIDNNGDSDLSNVQFADTLDPNTTLVPDSINVSPLAFADNYIGTGELRFEGFNLIAGGGGVNITDPASGLFSNDVEFLGDTFTLSTFDAISAQGGTVNVNADGTFTFDPVNDQFVGTDTFTYTITDSAGLSDSGTVSITVDNSTTVLTQNGLPITFSHVNDSNVPGDGSFENPHGSLSDANNDAQKANRDIVYIDSGTVFPEQFFELAMGQRFLGQGENHEQIVNTEQLGVVTLPTVGSPSAARPALRAPDGFFTLNAEQNTQISNFTIDNSGPGNRAGIFTGPGTLNVNRTDITGGLTGIDITNPGETLTFSDVTVTDPTGNGLQISGGSGLVLLDNSAINNGAGGSAVHVTGGHNGQLIFNPGTSITSTSGDGLQFDDADGTYNFNGTTTLNGGDAGIDILGGSAGTFTFTDTTIIDPIGAGIDIDGGSSTFTFGSTSGITKDNSGSTVRVQGGHTGTIVFEPGTGISATGTGAGDGLQFDDADGNYDFRGQVQLGGGDAGIDILGGSAGTFTFTDTSITDPTGDGININGGSSTITFDGLSNIAKNNGGSNVRVQGGHSGTITFDSNTGISATGASAGDGLQFDNADGTYDFRGTVMLNGGDAGIDILGGSAGTFTFSDTTSITTTTFDSAAVTIENFGAGQVDYNGDIVGANGGGELVTIDTTATGSTINFNNNGANSIVGNGAGNISIFSADGTITFALPTTIQNPSNSFVLTGISIFAGSGDISFATTDIDLPNDGFNTGLEINGHSGSISFNDLTIDVNGSGTPGNGMTGLSVFNAGTITITGNNSIDINGGPGIELNGASTINMTFDSITARNSQDGFGGGSGITLTNVGGGTFDVTGTTTVDGANGGAGIGIDIDDSSGTFTFANVDINDTTLSGISIGALSGNPGTVNINGGTVTNPGTNGARVNNAARVNLANTTINGSTGRAAVNITASSGTSFITSSNGTFAVPGGNADGVEITTTNTGNLCLNSTGSDATGSGTGFGLDLIQTGASTLGITQASLTDFQNENTGTGSLNTTGTISFDCVIPNGVPLLSDATSVAIASKGVIDASSNQADVADATSTVTNTATSIADQRHSNQSTLPNEANVGTSEEPGTLDLSTLTTIVDAAIERWTATGLNDSQVSELNTIEFSLANLPGWYLASTSGNAVQIDIDAGDQGWFIDTTPMDDSGISDGSFVGMDLLTTVMHEMGHVLGLQDSYDHDDAGDLMFGFLALGSRRAPHINQADGAVAGSITSTAFIGTPIDIGTLPAGKGVTITFQATINASLPPTVTQVSNQGVVSGSNFDSLNTDDPDTAAADDPTVTPIDEVSPAPGFDKVFAPNPIVVGGTSTLTFTIDNSTNLMVAAGLDFTDTLPIGIGIATPSNAATTCGGAVTAVEGSGVISFSGGTMSALSTCTVVVDVTSNMVGNFVNTSGDLTSSLGNSGTASDTLVVNQGTGAPPTITVPGALSTNEDATLSVPGISVDDSDSASLAVDLMVNDGRLDLTVSGSLTTFSGGGTGSVSLAGSLSDLNATLSSLTYTPNLNFNGIDQLNLTTSDGVDSDDGTVNITINPINDGPINTVPGPQALFNTDTLSFAPGFFSVSDVDASTLEVNFSVAVGSVSLGSTSGLQITGNNSTSLTATGSITNLNNSLGTLIYDPIDTFIGTDTLTMSTSDLGQTGGGGTMTDIDTVTITVGPPQVPLVVNDSYQADEGTGSFTLTPNPLDNDLKDSGATLTVISVNPLSTQGGFLSVSNDTFTYTPPTNTDFFGTETFTYTIEQNPAPSSTGDSADSGTITIEIQPINDAPINSVPGSVFVDEDNDLSFNGANLINVQDIDAGTGDVTVTLTVNSGMLNVTNTGGVQGNGNNQLTIDGTVSQVNNVLAGLSYAPQDNFFGSDALVVNTNDNGSTGATALSDNDTVNITINPINDAPTLVVPGQQSFFTDFDNRFSQDDNNTFQIDDVDAGPNDVRLDLTIADGDLTLDNTAGLTVSMNPGDNNGIRLVGSIDDINRSLANGVTYRVGKSGDRTLNAVVNDLGNTGSPPPGAGNQLTASASVLVGVADEVDSCLTGGPLQVGQNRLTYSCATPGGFTAFVVGTKLGSHFFDKYRVTVDIANPSVPAIGVGNIDGIATVLVELTVAQVQQDLFFQAFEMLPTPSVSNIISLPSVQERFDINVSGEVTPLDALLIINKLSDDAFAAQGETPSPSNLDYDVNDDGRVTPQDLLAVLNWLSDQTGFGNGEESSAAIASLADFSTVQSDFLDDDLLQQLVDDQVGLTF